MRAIKFLQTIASKNANSRKNRYGIEISKSDSEVLVRSTNEISFVDVLKLLHIILAISPVRFIKNIFNQMADYDTKKRFEKIQNLKTELEKHVSPKANIFTGFFVRSLFSRDLSEVPKIIEKLFFKTNPFLVVQPDDEKDIVSLFKFSNDNKIPIFPRGIGSSGFGSSIPTNNGIVIDLSPMNKIIAIDVKNMTVEVEPGSRWADVDREISSKNLSLYTFPTSRFSTIGGWISTGGFGLYSLKYDHLINHVERIRVIFPDGTIEVLTKEKPEFSHLFGTEGQIGIVTRVWLKVKKAKRSSPVEKDPNDHYHVIFFDSPVDAFNFSDEILKKGFDIANIKFYDKEYIYDLNYLLSISKSSSNDKFITEKDVLIIHYETKKASSDFLQYTKDRNLNFGESYMANYLWGDRFSPMKIKKLGPSLLASEILLPLDKVGSYMGKLKELGHKFEVKFVTQVNILLDKDTYKALLISMFTCDQRKFIKYFMYLNLVQYATLLGVQLGGVPYGIGIWNSPFLKDKYDKNKLQALKAFKRKVDPKFILNPMKILSLKSRFFNIPALLLHPAIFKVNTKIMTGLGQLLGSYGFFKIKKSKDEKLNQFKEIALQCTFCGSCSAICPAYITTKDERVIARSKLRLFQKLLDGKDESDSEPEHFFYCIRCGMCEKVCQSRLPLRMMWDELEKIMRGKYIIPEDKISEFIKNIDEEQQFVEIIAPKRKE
jgi:FAD/FMN-containing dehydrogenase/ferredoxin